MSEVEALLSVDAGRTPQGVVAFFAGDAEASERRVYAVMAALAGAAAVTCILAGGGKVPAALLTLASAVLGVLAAPTVSDDEEAPIKRQVLVVTPSGVIVRDEGGLRSWRFEELVSVTSRTYYQHRPQLVLVDRKGTCHVIDYLKFERGERLRDVIGERLRPRAAHAG